jgi:AcrR family transcriptional regulator
VDIAEFLTPCPSKREQARQRLITAAVELFGEQGLEGATVREIARTAGQNVAAIAYYFGGKRKLYQIVMEGIIRELRQRLGDVLSEIHELRRKKSASRAEALRLLKSFLCTVYIRLLSRNETLPVVRLIVREQLKPTAGFDILYDQGFREVHEGLCFLVGIILAQNPRDRQVIVRTHTLMGQVYFFAMSREAILRRLRWRDLEGKNAQLVTQVLLENLDALLAGLGTKHKVGKR